MFNVTITTPSLLTLSSSNRFIGKKGIAKRSIPAYSNICPWPLTSGLIINRFLLQSWATCTCTLYVKSYQNALDGFISINCSQGCFHICPLRPWPLTPDPGNHYMGFIVTYVLSLTKHILSFYLWVSISCPQGYFNICPQWPWPLTSNPLIMINTCLKFDEEAFNMYCVHKVKVWRMGLPHQPYYILSTMCCIGTVYILYVYLF